MKTQLAIVATVASIWATSAPAYAGGAAPVVEWDASGHFKPVKLAAFPDYALECESDPRHHIVLSIKPAEKTVTMLDNKGGMFVIPITDNAIAVTETYNRFGNKQLTWRIAILRFNSDGLRRELSNGNNTYQPYISNYVEPNDQGWRRYNCVPMAID